MRIAALVFISLVLLCSSVVAQTIDDFKIDSAEDLLVLCSVDPTTLNYSAATSFCHGYISGAYHYYKLLALANPSHKFICLPSPPPTRTTAINAFVVWMKENPRYHDGVAVDALFRYLGEKYPCGM